MYSSQSVRKIALLVFPFFFLNIIVHYQEKKKKKEQCFSYVLDMSKYSHSINITEPVDSRHIFFFQSVKYSTK